MKAPKEKNGNTVSYIYFVLIVGLLLRLGLSMFGTLNLDQGTFVSWANTLYSFGFKEFYNSWSDYLPGYPYILWILGAVNSYKIVPETLLFKIPAIIADLITGWIIYKILSKSKGEKPAIAGAALYVFNPAIIYNSTLWGQVDSLTSLFSMMAIYLVPVNLFFSAVSMAVGTVIKPQAAFIFPVIAYILLKNRIGLIKFLLYCGTGLSVFLLVFVPYWNHSSLYIFIMERLTLSLNQYQYTSVNAFNFWGLVGMWQPDNVYYQYGGYIFVGVLTLVLFYKLRKIKNPEYHLMSFVFAGSFIFFTRMHERHLLPVFAPLAVALIETPMLLIPYIILSLTYVANLQYAYVWITEEFRSIFSEYTIKLIEILNIGMFVSIFYIIAKNIRTKWSYVPNIISKFWRPTPVAPEKVLPKVSLSRTNSRLILITIMLFAFIARIFDLNSPPTMYFDEVYHAFTAKVMLGSEAAKAWEWWNNPPEGFAYEWTHPPIAKLGMALGMILFGETSFGYRIPGAILGLGAVFMIYLLSKEIFNDEIVGLFSASVFALDGLALVMSRIGMNDSYILFFVLLSLYLYMKGKNLLSALAFGFAISSKWSAIWAVPIFGMIMLSYRRKINWSYIWFFTIPFVVYLASYFGLFATGHDLKTWWEMQQQMWWYHTGLDATHPYGSPWWSWPLLIRPIYLYTSNEIGGMVSRIYAFGNPVVFWFGLISVFTILVAGIRERNKKLGLIAFSYFIFFVPWAMSPRIMFLYHYLPSVPFMAIAVGYVLRRNLKLVPYFFIPAILVFIYFYPHWSGLNIPLWLDSSYYWFSSWR